MKNQNSRTRKPGDAKKNAPQSTDKSEKIKQEPPGKFKSNESENVLSSSMAKNVTQWSDKQLEEYLGLLFDIEMNLDIEGENFNLPKPSVSSEAQYSLHKEKRTSN